MVKKNLVNPQAPVAKKIADKVVFRHLQGEGVESQIAQNLAEGQIQ